MISKEKRYKREGGGMGGRQGEGGREGGGREEGGRDTIF